MAETTHECINKIWFIHKMEYYPTYKKEWSTGACYNLDEPWKHYAKWKKSDTKRQILCDFIYMKYPV